MPDSSPAPPAISVAGLTKRFGDVVAVRSAAFELPNGELLGVLGPSGCGKTTMLRLLAGFERPDDGLVQIAGRTVVGDGVWIPPERRRVGIVPQDFALFPHLTVGQNVAFGLDRRAASTAASDVARWLRRAALPARAREMLELVGLADFAERYPHELSGGEAQRVALARALAPAPATVLLDEPFSNLDQNLRTSLRLQLREILRTAETAAVFVTHDREEALSLADRIAVMCNGAIEQLAAPLELYHRPASRFVATFVGNANILRGERSADGVDTPIGPLPISGAGLEAASDVALGAPLDILLRPEWISLHPGHSGPPSRQGRILTSEYYGHDQLVRVALTSGIELEARLHSAHYWRPDEPVSIQIEHPALAFPPER